MASGDFGLWNALYLAVVLSGIPLLAGVLSGGVVSILQAATSVQEQTLSFLTKLVAVVFVLYVFGGWGVSQLTGYLRQTLEAIPLM